MVQILNAKPSFGSKFSQSFIPSFREGLNRFLEEDREGELLQRKEAQNEMAQSRLLEQKKATAKALGLPEVAIEPSVQAALLKEQSKDKRNQALLERLERGSSRGNSGNGAQEGLSEDDILGIGVENPQIASLLQRQKESQQKKENVLRAENFPIRKELQEKAASAQQGIENKQKLKELIKTGNIDDPTVATLLESLPLNLGKRLLSPETVQYKAGLIDEFSDLRKIFQGQTRIKEIELLEQKIPDIYLTDIQKETILDSRINALKADIIRADAAAELEKEGKQYGVLEFGREVEKRAKPKLEALFNKILDEQNSVIKDAENRKKIPLDPKDPEDMQIAQQILLEAGGDRQKARALAKKKGYEF